MLYEMETFSDYLYRNCYFSRETVHCFHTDETYEYKWIFVPFDKSYITKQIRHEEGQHYWRHREDGSFIIYIRLKDQPRNKKEVIAFIAISPERYCPSVWVHPDHRRKGLCRELHLLAADVFDGSFETDDMRTEEYEAFLAAHAKKYPAFIDQSDLRICGGECPFNYYWNMTSTDLCLIEEGELDPVTGEHLDLPEEEEESATQKANYIASPVKAEREESQSDLPERI